MADKKSPFGDDPVIITPQTAKSPFGDDPVTPPATTPSAPTKDKDFIDALTDPIIEGGTQGVMKIMHAKGLKDVVGGASDTLRSLAPVLAGPYALTNPGAALAMLPGGVAGALTGHAAGSLMDLAPEYTQGLEDVGGMLGGMWSGNRIGAMMEPVARLTRDWFGLPQPKVNVPPSNRPTPDWLANARAAREGDEFSSEPPVPREPYIPFMSEFPSGRRPGTGEQYTPLPNLPNRTSQTFESYRDLRSQSGPTSSPPIPDIRVPPQSQFPSGRVPGPIPAPTQIQPVARQAIWEGFEPNTSPTPLPPVQGAQPGFPSGRIPGHIRESLTPPPVSPRVPLHETVPPPQPSPTIEPVQGPLPGFPSGRIPGHMKAPKIPVAPGTVIPTVEQQAAIKDTPFVSTQNPPAKPPTVTTQTQGNATIPNVEGVDQEYLEGREGLVGKVAQNQQIKARAIAKAFAQDPDRTEPVNITDPVKRREWALKAGYKRPFSDGLETPPGDMSSASTRS